MPDSPPDEVLGRQFRVVRRGYDRDEVDAMRRQVAEQLAASVSRIADLEAKVEQLGITETGPLAEELARVGGDISSLLDDAAHAATEMRRRAREDADRWMAEAEAEAERLRGDAWTESAVILAGAEEERARQEQAVRQEILAIRADAERDAMRMTTEARREAEEEQRAAHTEVERLLREARAEADAALEAAARSAEAAQERTRALEDRRTELLNELDAARRTINRLEEEIEVKHAVLSADPPQRSRSPEQGEWDEEAGVRIVPAARAVAPEAVDPDAFIAEVEELQSVPGSTPTSADTEPQHEVEPEPSGEGDEIGVQVLSDSESDAEDSSSEGDLTEPQPEVEVETTLPADDAGAPEPESEPEPVPEMEPVPELLEAAERPPIDDLFARLRAGEPEPESPEAPPTTAAPDPDPGGDAPVDDLADTDEPAGEAARPQLDAAAAIEVRERLLLPIQNRTFRDVKQAIVELQNVALEEIRTRAGGYSPDGDAIRELLAPGLDSGATQAYAAGFAAAAEMAGSATPPLTGSPPSEAADVAGALAAAADAAHRRVAAADGGSREAAAAVSRVFRAWRTDEAERRVRATTQRAFHAGLLAGLAGVGVDRVVAVTQGAACASCASVPGEPWDPAGGMPPGFPLPPAHEGCVTSPVPLAPGA